MTKFLLSVHVLAAIVAIGPVTVAASMFPAAARRALADSGTDRDVAVLRSLHRICRVYAAVGIVVPVFGLATANSLGVLGDPWLVASIALTVAAAGVLVLLVLPRQAGFLAALPESARSVPVRAGSVSDLSDLPDLSAPVRAGSLPDLSAPVRAGSLPDLSAPVRASAGPLPDRRGPARLAMYTGIFNLLWAVVTVLMIVRPGSTTGV